MVRTEVIDKFATLITGAFGLVAALAWNSAIQKLFQIYYSTGDGIGPLFLYAVIVTVLAVMFTLWIGKVSEKAKGPMKIIEYNVLPKKTEVKTQAKTPAKTSK